jgi:hypothetical protein
MEVSGQIQVPAALSPGKQPTVPYVMGGSGLGQSRSERYGEKKNPLYLPGIETRFLGCSACSPDAIPIELSQLTNFTLSQLNPVHFLTPRIFISTKNSI